MSDIIFNNEDIIEEFLKRLTDRDRRSCSLINKPWHRVFIQRKYNMRTVMGLPVFPDKIQLVNRMLQVKDTIHHVSLNAPPSYGKTFIGLLLALNLIKANDLTKVVIFVPAKCLLIWIKHITTYLPNMYNSKDPTKSIIGIPHSSVPKHHRYFKQPNLIIDHRILLTTHKSAPLYLYGVPNWVFIADEAQIGSVCAKIWIKCTALGHSRTYYLSASGHNHVYKAARKADYDKSMIACFDASYEEINDILPNMVITDYSRSFSSCLKDMLARYDKVIVFHRPKPYNYIFDPYGNKTTIRNELDIGNQTFDYCNSSNIPVFQHKRALKPIDQFHKIEGKAVLLLDYFRADVGHTINAEVAILHDIYSINNKRTHQVMGRIRRITNKNTTIRIVCMRNTRRHTVYDAKIYQAIFEAQLSDDLVLAAALNTVFLRIRETSYINDMLRALNLNMDNLSPLEFVYYVAPTLKSLSNKYSELKLNDPRAIEYLNRNR